MTNISQGLNEEDEKKPVDSFLKRLSRSGSGSGVSLHFDASFASEYGLDTDTEVEVNVIEKNGDVTFEIRNIPAGFTEDELREFAEHHGWKKTDEYINPGANEWYLTYRNSEGDVRIEIDSESQIDGNVVNNVIIQTDPIDVTGDYEKLARLCAEGQRKDVRVRVDDSEGNWEKFKASADTPGEDIPDEETFEQLSEASETVTAQMVCHRSSLNTTLEDLREIVNEMEEANQNVEAPNETEEANQKAGN